MNAILPTRLYRAQPVARLSPRTGFVLLALALHLALVAVWQQQPVVAQAPQEMTISFALQSVAMPARAVQPAVQQPAEKIEQAVAAPEVSAEAAPAAAVAAAAPVVTAMAASTEPDYKAAYLNNPPPTYPLAARRMGMQGRVLLQVQVLAAGVSGEVSIQQSSGFPVLDNAALQAVKSWRFAPATQAGRAVDKWFMIPVQFSLKEQSA